MDPQESVKRIAIILGKRNFSKLEVEELIDCSISILEWVGRGGFLPKVAQKFRVKEDMPPRVRYILRKVNDVLFIEV